MFYNVVVNNYHDQIITMNTELIKPTDFTISSSNSNLMDMGVSMDDNTETSVFFLLSSTLYKEPHKAIIRELVSNAIDASKKANISQPVVLNVPCTTNDEFYIQDFGIGMSLDQVINLYGNYFASNKQNDANSIGGFGLGGKTPFIYVKDSSDGFKLETTSPEDNVRRTFIFKMVKNKYGGLKPIYYHLDNLDEVDSLTKGTKVSFKLYDEDNIALFAESISDIVFSTYPIQFKGVFELDDMFDNVLRKIGKNTSNNIFFSHKEILDKIDKQGSLKLNNHFSYINFKNSNLDYHKVSLLLNNIYYEYTLDEKGAISLLYRRLFEINEAINVLSNSKESYFSPIFISLNNTAITVSLSRENIQKNETNENIIYNMLVQYLHIEIDNVKIKFNIIIKDIINQIKQPNLSLLSKYDLYCKIKKMMGLDDVEKIISENDLIYINEFYQNFKSIFIDNNNIFYDKLELSRYQYDNLLDFLFKNNNVQFFILDDYRDMHFCAFNELRDFLNNITIDDSHIIIPEIIISKKQYDLLVEHNFNFTYEPINLNQSKTIQILANRIREDDEKAVQEQEMKRQKILEEEAIKLKQKHEELNKIKPKLLENEKNGFYVINFEESFSKKLTIKKDNIVSVFKKSENTVKLNPIALPKTIKLDITSIKNPILEKNIQFLIDMNMLHFDNNVLIDKEFLKDTNKFLNQFSFKTRFFPSDFWYNFKHISHIIQFQFVDDDKFNNLNELDLLQYILNSIDNCLNKFYQQLNTDFHYWVREGLKYHLDQTYLSDKIFIPFSDITYANYSIIIDNILHKKISGYIDNLIDDYFKDVNDEDKLHFLIKNLRIFEDLRYYHQNFNLPFVNNNRLDFFSKYSSCVCEHIKSVYERKDIDKQGLKYSKDFYQEYIKPILEQY